MDNTFQLLEAKKILKEWEETYVTNLHFYGPDHYKTAYARGGMNAAADMFELMGGNLYENQTTDENL